VVVHRDQHRDQRRFLAVFRHQQLWRGERLQPPQRQPVVQQPEGSLRIVLQVALHIRPARPAWQQRCQIQLGHCAKIAEPADRVAALPQAASPVLQQG
jgi:hypothetical protein